MTFSTKSVPLVFDILNTLLSCCREIESQVKKKHKKKQPKKNKNMKCVLIYKTLVQYPFQSAHGSMTMKAHAVCVIKCQI